MHDVRNAGAALVYDRKHRSPADARRPYVISEFMNLFLEKLNERAER